MDSNLQKSLSPVLVIILGLTLIAAGGIYYLSMGATPSPSPSSVNDVSTSSQKNTEAVNSPVGLKQYEDKTLGVSFQYPGQYGNPDQEPDRIYIDYDPNAIGMGSGLSIGRMKSTLANWTTGLKKNNAYNTEPSKMIADEEWTVLHYDPQKDTRATDNAETVTYFKDHAGYLYYIQTDFRGSEKVSKQAIQSNLEQILSSFRFTQ